MSIGPMTTPFLNVECAMTWNDHLGQQTSWRRPEIATTLCHPSSPLLALHSNASVQVIRIKLLVLQRTPHAYPWLFGSDRQ
jgi:hypothetical protein